MRTTVGRTYRVRATHSLPDFPEPWCFPHQHDYTIIIEAQGGTPTDELDAWMVPFVREPSDMNALTDPDPSTVENIAELLLEQAPGPVRAVTVWEDRQRWGRAEQ